MIPIAPFMHSCMETSFIQRNGLLICASAKQKQQIIKMQMLWNVFQVSAVELERARVQLISANEIIECG